MNISSASPPQIQLKISGKPLELKQTILTSARISFCRENEHLHFSANVHLHFSLFPACVQHIGVSLLQNVNVHSPKMNLPSCEMDKKSPPAYHVRFTQYASRLVFRGIQLGRGNSPNHAERFPANSSTSLTVSSVNAAIFS